jgi:O-antigen/teichoic acid export membrane protein
LAIVGLEVHAASTDVPASLNVFARRGTNQPLILSFWILRVRLNARPQTGQWKREQMDSHRRKLLRAVLGPRLAALLDQAVVSGVSFLTMIMIGRWTNPAELGLYAIGVPILLSVLATQQTLISLPYQVRRCCPTATAVEHAGSALAQCGLLALLTIVLLPAAALVLSASGAPELAALTWTLAAVAPFVLLRDFGRNFAFAQLHSGQALRLDLVVAAIQLATLCWLGWTGSLSANAAYVAIGAACAVPSILWLYRARADFAVRTDRLRSTMKRNWTLGKWLFGVEVTRAVQGYLAYGLLAWLAGTRETGIFAASASVAMLLNPLIFGLGNIFVPRAALAFKERGIEALQREVNRDLLLRAVPMALFCLAVLFAGNELLYLLYRSEDFAGHGHAVTVLAVANLALVMGNQFYMALLVMEHPREVFRTEALAATLTVALIWSLVGPLGLLGAAYACLIGNVLRLTGWWLAYTVLAAAHRNQPEVTGETGLSKVVAAE